MAGQPNFDNLSFRAAIADALRQDFGSGPASVKRVAKLVQANDRGVRNWFDATNGPSGEHLVALMRHSPAVVAAVLGMSGQSELLRVKFAASVREKI